MKATLRKIAIRLLQRFNPGDITIRHHYTRQRLFLHSFRHKGYWYHGRRRELATMRLYAQLIRPGAQVLEVGGHIGYVAMYFSKLAGASGQVLVFEPGANNLPYLRRNIAGLANVQLVEKAAADFSGSADFYLENLTGQNNSLLGNYDVLPKNIALAGLAPGRIQQQKVSVECVTLDGYFQARNLPPPDFVKIDVEGGEYAILRGMATLLQTKQMILMVEVTFKKNEAYELLKNYDYRLFKSYGREVLSADNMSGNIFAFKVDDPRISQFIASAEVAAGRGKS